MGLARVDVRAPAGSSPIARLRARGAGRAPFGPWRRAAVCAVSLLLVAGSAVAGEPAGSSRYRVPAECPAHEVWREQLQARLPASPAAWAAMDGLVVTIEPRSKAGATDYHGLIRARDGRAAEAREVHGPSCREVFDALVLVAALSLEGQAGAGAAVGEPPAVDASIDVASAPPPRTPGAPRWSWAALGLALVQTGIAPEPSLDVGLAAVVRSTRPGLEPWLMVGFYAALREQSVQVEEAVAHFDHWSTRLLVGAWRYPLEGPLAVRPALGVDVGQVQGRGAGVSVAASNSGLWLSARGELRFEAVVAEHVLVGAAGGAAVPLLRPRFYFEPGAVVFHAPALGLEASGFAALLF